MPPEQHPPPRIDDPRLILDIAIITELQANCRIFLVAWKRFQKLAKHHPRLGQSVRRQEATRMWMFDLWGEAYSMTHAARRIVRVLWDTKGSQSLRKESRSLSLLGQLSQSSPVVAVRDAMEHTEREIPWFLQEGQKRGATVLSGWGVSDDPMTARNPQVWHFRRLNHRTFELFVRDSDGEHLGNLGTIASDVKRLQSMLSKGKLGGTFTIVSRPTGYFERLFG